MNKFAKYADKQYSKMRQLQDNLRITERIERNQEVLESMSDMELQIYNSNERGTLKGDKVYKAISNLYEMISLSRFDSHTLHVLGIRKNLSELDRKIKNRQMTEQEYNALSSIRNGEELFDYLAKQGEATIGNI